MAQVVVRVAAVASHHGTWKAEGYSVKALGKELLVSDIAHPELAKMSPGQLGEATVRGAVYLALAEVLLGQKIEKRRL